LVCNHSFKHEDIIINGDIKTSIAFSAHLLHFSAIEYICLLLVKKWKHELIKITLAKPVGTFNENLRLSAAIIKLDLSVSKKLISVTNRKVSTCKH
jgi:3-methyladenine DNA glycosylase AlkC